jgi:hypothetical protein
MVNNLIAISDQPKYPFAKRHLRIKSVVDLYTATPQAATVRFDLLFTDANGVAADGMNDQERLFTVSNSNWVDKTTGMTATFSGEDANGPYTLGPVDPTTNTATHVTIANTARQYDYFKAIIASKAYTQDELITKYVVQSDLIHYFD